MTLKEARTRCALGLLTKSYYDVTFYEWSRLDNGQTETYEGSALYVVYAEDTHRADECLVKYLDGKYSLCSRTFHSEKPPVYKDIEVIEICEDM